MTILSDLLVNPIFKYLAQVQAHLDDTDSVLKEGSMTRSPYHLIAFFLTWKLIGAHSKPWVLSKLKQIGSTTPIPLNPHLTVNALDGLVNSLDWPKLFTELKEFNPDFLQLLLSPDMVDAISKQNDLFFKTLLSNQVITHGEKDIVKIKTTLNQEASWKTPFTEQICPLLAKETWKVKKDTFSLSSSLKEFINQQAAALKESGSSTVEKGAFTINIDVEIMQAPKSQFGKVHYDLFIDNQSKQQLETKFVGDINSGIYNSFIGAQFVVGHYFSKLIEAVFVEVIGMASIDKIGTKVRQEQEVSFLNGCCPPKREDQFHEIRNISATILVNNLCALFRSTQIAVNFKQTKTEPAQNTDLNIALHTMDADSAVLLYPYRVSNQHVVKTMDPADSTKLKAPNSQFSLFPPSNNNNSHLNQQNQNRYFTNFNPFIPSFGNYQ